MGTYSDIEDKTEEPASLQDILVQNLILDFGECGFRCVRCSFFLSSLSFCLTGLATLLTGIWLNTTHEDISTELAQQTLTGYLNAANFLIIFGLVVLTSSLLACCGSRRNNIGLLTGYAVLLCLLITAEFTAIILSCVYRDKIEKTMADELYSTLDHYGVPGYEKLTSQIDSLQRRFSCCGNTAYTDWLRINWNPNKTQSVVPLSCCLQPTVKNCNILTTKNTDNIFVNGCHQHLKKYMLENLHVIRGFSVWILVIGILGILFSLCLIITLRRRRKLFAGDIFSPKRRRDEYSMEEYNY